MEKTIKIGNKSVRLNNNIGWAIAYRDQFGRDIVPTIMPLFASALDIMSGIINETGKVDDIDLADIAKLANGDALIDAVLHLGGFELTDLINITWAMAKSANDDIPDPKEWVKQFSAFPLDVIGPEVFGLMFRGVISSKNLKRLEDLKKRVQPTIKQNSIQSSSQESNED